MREKVSHHLKSNFRKYGNRLVYILKNIIISYIKYHNNKIKNNYFNNNDNIQHPI